MLTRQYAQTYPALMNQAQAKGLPTKDLVQLKACYEYAQTMFDGMYRGQHSPFIGHLTRTGSILLEEDAPLDVVFAGILHAVYMVGCFNDRRHGKSTDVHRTQIRQDMGENVEAYIYDYDCLPWYHKDAVYAHLRHIETYDERQRNLVLMRLCNDLEDYLDFGIAYRGVFPFKKKLEDYGDVCIELAKKLGRTQLAGELATTFEQNLSVQIPDELHTGYRDSYQLPHLKWLKKSLHEKIIIVGRKKIKNLFLRSSHTDEVVAK